MTDLEPIKTLHQSKWAQVKKDGIALHIADMDFQTCPHIIAELRNVNIAGTYSYAWPSDQQKEGIVSYFSKKNCNFEKEALCFVPGLVSGIDIVLRALLKPGDEMIVLTPEYPMILNVAKLHPVTCVEVPLKETQQHGGLHYSIDINAIKDAITSKTRLILFSSPHNPTGTCFTKEELLNLADLCIKQRLQIVSDEIWSDLILDASTYTHVSALSDDIENYTISLLSPSKTYNLAGLSGGMLVCSNDEVRQKIEQYCLVHLPVHAHVAFAKAYQENGDWLNQKIALFNQSKTYLTEFFQDHFPSFLVSRDPATYLLWIKTPFPCTSSWIKKLEQEQGVKLSEGSTFGEGYSSYFRLSYATPFSILKEACKRIKTLR